MLSALVLFAFSACNTDNSVNSDGGSRPSDAVVENLDATLDDSGAPLDKRSALLADPHRAGFGENATGGSNIVEVSTEAEFYEAIQVSDNYVSLTPALAGQTFVRNSTTSTNANNLTIDGSLAPGFTIQVGPSMPNNSWLFRFFGDNIIIHDIAGQGIDYTTRNNQSFLNMYGTDTYG